MRVSEKLKSSLKDASTGSKPSPDHHGSPKRRRAAPVRELIKLENMSDVCPISYYWYDWNLPLPLQKCPTERRECT